MHRSVALLIAWLGTMSVAQARPHPTVSGKYTGDRGDATLVQDGTRVVGAFRADGEIDGEIESGTLHVTWREHGAVGRALLFLAGNGELIGTWGSGDSDRDGGTWRLAPVRAVPVALAAVPVDHTGAWSLDIRFPWDVTLLSGSTGIGVGGFGVGGGVRVTDHLYLGASADFEVVLVSGRSNMPPSGPGSLDRLRAGAEARYYSDNLAPSVFGGHQSWVGLRGGLETVDGDATSGHFAELSLGRDTNLGPLLMGMYVSAGLSFERASAYQQDATSSPGSARTVDAARTLHNPFFTLGMRLAFQ